LTYSCITVTLQRRTRAYQSSVRHISQLFTRMLHICCTSTIDRNGCNVAGARNCGLLQVAQQISCILAQPNSERPQLLDATDASSNQTAPRYHSIAAHFPSETCFCEVKRCIVAGQGLLTLLASGFRCICKNIKVNPYVQQQLSHHGLDIYALLYIALTCTLLLDVSFGVFAPRWVSSTTVLDLKRGDA